MTELPAVLNQLARADRTRMRNAWTERGSAQAHALLGFTAATLGAPPIDAAGSRKVCKATSWRTRVSALQPDVRPHSAIPS